MFFLFWRNAYEPIWCTQALKTGKIISTVWIRRGGAPSGAAAFIVFWGYGGLNPHQEFQKAEIIEKSP